MLIKSKYNTSCKRCGCRITVGEDIEWRKNIIGVTHATLAQCDAAKLAQKTVTQIAVDLMPIVNFIKAAQQRGLKYPKLRVLDVDGKTEMQLGLTVQGSAPGSLVVKINGQFFGRVMPGGVATGQLASDQNRQSHLAKVASDPAGAAKEYAALMCQCSFCGLALTDEGSVDVGYGPVCASHWGLPHKAKGTPHLTTVPVTV